MTAVATERLRIIKAHAEALRDVLGSGVIVTHRTQPRDDEIRSRMVYPLTIDGTLDTPVFTGARLPRDDQMTVEWLCAVGGIGQDEETVELAICEQVDAFDDLAADDHNFTADTSTKWHAVTSVDGPYLRDGGGSGLIGEARVTVEYHLRLV